MLWADGWHINFSKKYFCKLKSFKLTLLCLFALTWQTDTSIIKRFFIFISIIPVPWCLCDRLTYRLEHFVLFQIRLKDSLFASTLFTNCGNSALCFSCPLFFSLVFGYFMGRQSSCEACVTVVFWFVSSAARTVAEAAPTWLSPTGSSSSKLVLQGEELLLECIAAGVWVWAQDYSRLSVKLSDSLKATKLCVCIFSIQYEFHESHPV